VNACVCVCECVSYWLTDTPQPDALPASRRPPPAADGGASYSSPTKCHRTVALATANCRSSSNRHAVCFVTTVSSSTTAVIRLEFQTGQTVVHYPATLINNLHVLLTCSDTNVMHFVFSLLRIKGLYMFRALPTHLQETIHKQHLVYCVCYVSSLLAGLEWNAVPLQSW
jgi:hypothetical protein